MSAVSKIFFLALLFAGATYFSDAFNGDATFYGGAGSGGACSSSYVPDGYRTVAMNNAQYDNGRACGTCVEGCFNYNGSQQCFKAIVDNLCPECSYGDLDLGWSGDGRWDLTWNFIDCPAHDPIFSTQGSNCWYGKLKIEGLGPMNSVQLNGINASSTPDGYWVVNDNSGGLCCGPKLVANYPNGTINQCLSGSMFGGGCTSGQTCSGSSSTTTQQTVVNSDSYVPPAPAATNPQVPTVNQNVAGSHCENGIPHSDGVACCPKSCGKCGGPNCSLLPGGADSCCSSQIRINHRRPCAQNPAPCTM